MAWRSLYISTRVLFPLTHESTTLQITANLVFHQRTHKMAEPPLSSLFKHPFLTLDPAAPRPEDSPKDYSQLKIKRRLEYVAQKKIHRNISPRTLKFLNLYGEHLELALVLTNEADKLKAGNILIEYDKFIQESSFISGLPTEEAARLQRQTLQLRKFEYMGRYGDYWARECKSLKDQAKEAGVEGQDVLLIYWTQIHEKITAERAVSRTPSKDTPTLLLVYNTCSRLNISPEHMLWAIQRYAERNDIMHSSVQELIQRGDWTELAILLYNDASDLDWVIPEDMKGDLMMMKITIDEVRNAYFEIDPGDEFNPRSWIASKKARVLKAQFRQEEAKRIANLESEIASMKDVIARREAKQAAEEDKLVKAVRGVKRKSGSDLPDWAKREKAKKLKQVAEVVGVQGKIEAMEAALDRRYVERTDLVKGMKEWALN